MFSFLLFSGCSNAITLEESKSTKIYPGNVKTYENIFTAEDLDADVNIDGEIDNIKLLVTPPPGEIDGTTYPLFDDSVQGGVSLFIVQENEGENSIIFQKKGTYLEIVKFRYNQDGYFEKQVIYEAADIIERSTIIR